MPCSAVCARYDRRHGHCRERTYGGEQRTSLLLVAACSHQPGLALCVCASSLTCDNAQTCNSTWIVQRMPVTGSVAHLLSLGSLSVRTRSQPSCPVRP